MCDFVAGTDVMFLETNAPKKLRKYLALAAISLFLFDH
jgi:hypothetical protein